MLSELGCVENHESDENRGNHGHHGNTGEEALAKVSPVVEFSTIVVLFTEFQSDVAQNERQVNGAHWRCKVLVPIAKIILGGREG